MDGNVDVEIIFPDSKKNCFRKSSRFLGSSGCSSMTINTSVSQKARI